MISPNQMRKKVIVVLGQTATGKSSLAVKIALRLRSGRSGSEKPSGSMRPSAQKFGGEIISADSRQVYKGLDIGTGKISKKEMKGIPHHLLDVANPKKQFTVSEYKKLAEEKIKEIIDRKNIPIICGGTGFYIDAVTRGTIFPEVPPNNKLRKQLVRFSAIALFLTLKKLDQKRAQDIRNKSEQNNKVRLIRAIEIAKALGRVPCLETVPSSYKFIKIGLYLPENELRKKIEKRVKGMFQFGLLREIKKLKKSGVSKKRFRELGFEYNNPTHDKVISETLKYAKRQMTWFKRDKEIKWFTNPASAFLYIHKLLAKSKL